MARDGVQSVERSFALLRALATQPAGISELARRTDLAVSTTARLLNTMEALGAVERIDAAGVQFRIGATIGQLATAVDPSANLVARAKPFLLDLVHQLGETAGISVPHGDSDVLYLYQVDSDHAVQLRDWTGTIVAIHVVSSGLALLAQRDELGLDQYFNSELVRCTEHSIVDPVHIRERLAQTRSSGFVWTIEEFAPGISSIAAPIFDDQGRAIAAVHIHGPSFRFPDAERRNELEHAIRQTAAALSGRRSTAPM